MRRRTPLPVNQGSDEPVSLPPHPNLPRGLGPPLPNRRLPQRMSVGDADKTETPFVLEGLEDPAIDAGGSLITTSIDDDELAANRPVILGAYGEEPETPPAESGAEPATAAGDGLDADAPDAPDSADEAVVEPEAEPEPAEESDFIVLDQDQAEPETPATADEESASTAVLDLDSIASAGHAAGAGFGGRRRRRRSTGPELIRLRRLRLRRHLPQQRPAASRGLRFLPVEVM